MRTRAEESVQKGERATENKMERRVPTRLETYWVESG